jgi:hypothetical protein
VPRKRKPEPYVKQDSLSARARAKRRKKWRRQKRALRQLWRAHDKPPGFDLQPPMTG